MKVLWQTVNKLRLSFTLPSLSCLGTREVNEVAILKWVL